jgi:hypothetical protein
MCDDSCPAVPASGGFDLGDYDYATHWSPSLKGKLRAPIRADTAACAHDGP